MTLIIIYTINIYTIPHRKKCSIYKKIYSIFKYYYFYEQFLIIFVIQKNGKKMQNPWIGPDHDPIGQPSGENTGKAIPLVDLRELFYSCPGMNGEILKQYRIPYRLKAGVFVLCLQGTLEATIQFSRHSIGKDDFISILPDTIIQCHSQSEDLRLAFIAFSGDAVGAINIQKSSLDSLPLILEHPVIGLPPQTSRWFQDYFNLMGRASSLISSGLHPEIIKCIFESVLYGISYIYHGHLWEQPKRNRSEEIYNRFLQLVRKQYRKERGVAYYAGELGISQQHLSITIRNLTGKNPLDIIAETVITDIRAQLKSTNSTIREIARDLNFPNSSSLGTYFKRYMHMSPLQYRSSTGF